MKTYNLLISFFFAVSLSYSQSEREIINQIDVINTQALNYYNESNIVDAYSAFRQALKMSDSINDSYGSAVANFNLGRIYSYMREYEASEKCFKKMLQSSLKIEDNYLIANSYMGLAELYDIKNQESQVIPNFEMALNYALKNDVRDQDNQDMRDIILYNIRMNLSRVYLKRGNANQALIYLLRAKNNLDKIPNNNNLLASYYNAYGDYFVNAEMFSKANEQFQLALDVLNENSSNNSSNLLYSEVYKDISVCYAKLGINDLAYEALLNHNNYRELFINEEKVRQENIAKSKFYLAQYQQIAERANEERILQEQITQKVKKINIVIVFTTLILVVSLIMLYINYRSKRRISLILKAQNEKLEYAKEQAERSSELKTKFISNVTHELRTPLYGVVGLTSLLLRKNDLSERDAQYLKSLKYSGDYLLNLVNDILQIGKIESEKVELRNVSVNLKEFIGNIKDSFQYKLQETNNKIEIHIDSNIPQYLKFDSIKISQVLINLIGNAIKFSENEIVQVGVKLLNLKTNEVTLEFSVSDRGPGIPKDKQESIFENFSQLDEENNVNYKGTGLGLSISKRIVELFGSSIELDSELGKGSTFSFKVTFEVDNSIKVEANKNTSKMVSLNRTYRILLAEDNKINQIVTQNILEKGNFQCDIAKNGLEAVNMIRAGNYDLILMDIHMPLMDGNQATKEIRKNNTNIPIIALTAADIEEMRKDCQSMGYNDIITKPFDNDYFYQTILTSIHNSKGLMDNNSVLFKVS